MIHVFDKDNKKHLTFIITCSNCKTTSETNKLTVVDGKIICPNCNKDLNLFFTISMVNDKSSSILF